jgi:hypothetical protein
MTSIYKDGVTARVLSCFGSTNRSAVVYLQRLEALTPLSLTPVAPHLAADTGFFWYW